MTRTVEQIVTEAHGQRTPFGPNLVAGYVHAVRELADDHGMTVKSIARTLALTEHTVLRYLNEEHDWRREVL
jgi:DNA invertase Pin-like site-specific DNA recombinase